jgi:hypothetical protein
MERAHVVSRKDRTAKTAENIENEDMTKAMTEMQGLAADLKSR